MWKNYVCLLKLTFKIEIKNMQNIYEVYSGSSIDANFIKSYLEDNGIGVIVNNLLENSISAGWVNPNSGQGATVSVYDKYTVKSAKYGEAKTDNHGNFLISGIPEGKQYLYVFGNKNEFWVSGVTPFQMEKGKGTEAKDTYLCKGFYPISPIKDAIIHTKRPILKWKPYPDAVDYAVRLIRVGDSRFIFSRGDNDSRITKTQVQLDIDLTPGKYRWRVDAFNVEGHIIGCSYYSASKFKVSF